MTDAGIGISQNRQWLGERQPVARENNADGMTIGELARAAGVTQRALRFYESKGLLGPVRGDHARLYTAVDRDQLDLILQGKRLGFTLGEIREMLAARTRGCDKALSISRKKCVEQIQHLERQRRDIELALAELRQIYTGMFKAILHSQDSLPDSAA